jgi:hypothetical protein
LKDGEAIEYGINGNNEIGREYGKNGNNGTDGKKT